MPEHVLLTLLADIQIWYVFENVVVITLPVNSNRFKFSTTDKNKTMILNSLLYSNVSKHVLLMLLADVRIS